MHLTLRHRNSPLPVHLLTCIFTARVTAAQVLPIPVSAETAASARLACTTDACAAALVPTPSASSSGLAACASWLSDVVTATDYHSTVMLTSTATLTVTGDLSLVTGAASQDGIYNGASSSADSAVTSTTTITSYVTDVRVRTAHMLGAAAAHGWYRNISSTGAGSAAAATAGVNNTAQAFTGVPRTLMLRHLRKRLEAVALQNRQLMVPDTTLQGASQIISTTASAVDGPLAMPTAYAGPCRDAAALLSACQCLDQTAQTAGLFGPARMFEGRVRTMTVTETMTRTVAPESKGTRALNGAAAPLTGVPTGGITAATNAFADPAVASPTTAAYVDFRNSKTVAAPTGRLVLRSWPRFRARTNDSRPMEGQYIAARRSRWEEFAMLLQGTKSREDASLFSLQPFGRGWALMENKSGWVVAQGAWSSGNDGGSKGNTTTSAALSSSSATGTGSWSMHTGIHTGIHMPKRVYSGAPAGRWNTSSTTSMATRTSTYNGNMTTTAGGIVMSTPYTGERAMYSALLVFPVQLVNDARLMVPICTRRWRGSTVAGMGLLSFEGKGENDAHVEGRTEELYCSQPNDESVHRRQAMQYCKGDRQWLQQNGFDAQSGYLGLDEYVDRDCERVMLVFES